MHCSESSQVARHAPDSSSHSLRLHPYLRGSLECRASACRNVDNALRENQAFRIQIANHPI